MTSATPLSPIYYGQIASTQDALLLFEACLSGTLNRVARRPRGRERSNLIRSGNVFVYEEHKSGIKRWTDGVSWSPSRVLGNFLIYRELESASRRGEKRRARKSGKRSPRISKGSEQDRSLSNGINNGYNEASAAVWTFCSENSNCLRQETQRSLVGSLNESYGFKEEGLVKKTISVIVGGVSYRLVSYYTITDVMSNKFSTPTKDPRFQYIIPRRGLVTEQNFRSSIYEINGLGRIKDISVCDAYSYSLNGREMTNHQSISHCPMFLPTVPINYPRTSSRLNNYTMTPDSAYSDGWNSDYAVQFATAPDIYPVVTQMISYQH